MAEGCTLVGDGYIKVEGGCLAPQYLNIDFAPAADGVEMTVDSHWFRNEGFFTARGRIGRQRFQKVVSDLKTVSDGPEEAPLMSSAAMGVNYHFPLETGPCSGGAHEMVQGPSPGAMIDIAFALADLALTDPNFELRCADPPPSDEKESGFRFPSARLIIFLVVVFFVSTLACLYFYY